MKEEPEIIKELREREKLGLLYNKVQVDFVKNHLLDYSYEEHGSENSDKIYVTDNSIEKVIEPENLYRMIAENASDMIAMVTFELNPVFVYVSPSHRYLGYNPQELLGKCVWDFIHPEDKKKLIPLLKKYLIASAKKLLTSKDIEVAERIEFYFKDKSGTWHYLQSTANLIGNHILLISRDITEHKQMEEKLRESEELFETLVSSAPVGIYIYDPIEKKMMYANPIFRESLGIKDEDIYKTDIMKYLTPESRKLIEKRIKDRLAGKKISPDVEVEAILPSGERRWIKLHTSFVEYKGKKAMISVVLDLTENKKMVEKLEESEKRLRDLFDNANDLIQSVDQNGRFVYVNKSWLKTLGYTKEELKNLTIFDILHKDYIAHCKKIIEEISKGKSFDRMEAVFITKDGREIYVEGSINGRFENGKFVSTRAIFRDVTERKKMEAELKALERRFEDIALSSGDFIWEIDSQGRYTFIGGRIEDILGYSAEELLGKTPFDIMPPDEAVRIKKIFKNFSSNKEPIVDLENRSLTKDGKIKYLLTNGVPILDDQGNLLGYRGVDKDITERKMVEEELKKAYKETETLLDAAADGIRIVNRDFTVRTLNSTMAKLAGIEKNKAVGMKCYEMFGAEVCGTEKCSMRRVLKEKKQIHTETVRRRMDGKQIPCLHVATPIKDADGRIVGIIEDFRDITEQKKIEQALIENEEKFRAISDSAYDAIIMMDDNGNVSYWNKAAEKVFGYKANEILGKNLHYLFTPSKYQKEHEKGFTIFKKTGKGNAVGKTLELTALRKSGREFIAELSLSTVKLNDRWYAIGIVRDISERKAIEEELKEKLKELETFYKVAVDRELRMIELKREVNELCEKCGEKPRYAIDKIETGG